VANRRLVHLAQSDIPESWQQVIAQKAPIQLCRPHFKHTILQLLLCIVAEKYARMLGINPVTATDLGFLERQPADRIGFPGKRLRRRPKPAIRSPVASLVTPRLTSANSAEIPSRDHSAASMSTRPKPGSTACGPPSAPTGQPTKPMSSLNGELAQLASRTCHVLIDFDGPVCQIFAGIPSHAVANELRSELNAAGIGIPQNAATLDDPLEVFRVVADQGDAEAISAQELLTALEVRAAQTAQPMPGSADLIATATQTGRTVTVVTNNSGAAVAAYLGRHHLGQYVTKIVGRDDPDPALMKPSPYQVRYAVGLLQAEPGSSVFIGHTVTDVLAGLLGGVAVIGYANKPGKAEALSHAGARTVVTNLAEITTALRTAPSPALPN
jgi:phosphoglycolate phosphatase